MAKEVLFLVEEAAEGGYTACALGYSIFTKADTWDELREAVRDAVHCHFDLDEQPELIHVHLTAALHPPAVVALSRRHTRRMIRVVSRHLQSEV